RPWSATPSAQLSGWVTRLPRSRRTCCGHRVAHRMERDWQRSWSWPGSSAGRSTSWYCWRWRSSSANRGPD
ncbi:MAG: hypothetical protein ACK55I_03280, partial [bacterium]